MARKTLPHYRQLGRNFVTPPPRGRGGYPPASPPWGTPPWSGRGQELSPYAHLLGRAAYPPQRGFAAWIGDRLNLPEVVILRGHVHRHDVYALLRSHGVRVRRVGYQQAAGCGWRLWARDTYIRVERYHGLAAETILRDAGFEDWQR